MQAQADTIARLERELAEAKEIAALTPNAEALRALASWGSSDADNRVKFHVGNQANVWLIDASSKVHYAGGATLAAAIMDALALANANRAA
jgi:hypothetical protein